MKKLYTIVSLMLSSLSIMATDFKDCSLAIKSNISTNIEKSNTTVFINGNTFSINGLKYDNTDLGNVELTNLQVIIGYSDGTMVYATSEPQYITIGGEKVAANFRGEVRNSKFRGILNLTIHGSNYIAMIGDKADELGQLPNAGFENFHAASGTKEPNGWHSFKTCTGSLSGTAGKANNTFIESTEKHSGTNCVKVQSAILLYTIPANGTMTTGRLHAGNMSAANTANNSTMDFSDKGTDGNGDPFYPIFTTKPDAMTVWVKFKGNVKEHPYATVKAILANDKVQDPEKDDYKKNVIARAANAQIESNNFAWQELNIPFKYENKNTPKGMLVTISTNAEAGKASSDKKNLDVIYVDDIAMIYNSSLKSAQYKNNANLSFADNKAAIEIEGKANEADFSIASDGEGAYISKVLKTNEGETGKSTLYITITSNDLQKSNCFEVAITDKTATGIFNIKSDSNATSSTLYNLAGQQVSNSYKGIIIKNGKKYINK
nr:hypothetical protein [uncultured Prevotella sp.]